MDELLEFTGIAKSLSIYKAPVTRGTFSEKEGKKELYCSINFNDSGEVTSVKREELVENYVYHEENLLCKHVAREDKSPIYKIDYFWEDSLMIRRTRTNEQGVVEEDESFTYDEMGQLIEKKSKTLTYQYIYENNLLIEERWHSEFTLNQIIRYTYNDNGKLTEIQHLSGEEIPGRKVEYKRESHDFITEEVIYSPTGSVISHKKYLYPTIYKNNWLKRQMFVLHSQNRRKEAIDVTYREFEYFDEPVAEELPEIVPEAPILEEEITSNHVELEFDNGFYKGEVLNGEMHGSGEFIFNTGTRYQGSFKHNKMDGRGKLSYINGKVYEGTFKNNLLEGPGACKWENGDFYAGEFKNGKMHGKGCYIWENGNRFEGIFEDNKRTDQGILYKAEELESTSPPDWVNDLF